MSRLLPDDPGSCPCCTRCDTEYRPDHHDNGICQDCHDDAGEVWCEICRRWAVGVKGETDACHECLNELHAEANRVDDERRYLESA